MIKHDLIGFLKFNRQGDTMQVTEILHQILDGAIHKTRIKSLTPIIQAIIVSKELRLTEPAYAVY